MNGGWPRWPWLSTNLAIHAAIVLFNAILIGLIWQSVFAIVRSERVESARAATNTADNLVIAFAQYTRRTIEGADFVVQSLIREQADHGDKLDLLQFMADHRSGNKALSRVVLSDEYGNARLASAEGGQISDVNVADREHFSIHRNRNSSTPFVGKPVLGRQTQKAVIPITRRIDKADGSFAGVAMAFIEPSIFTDFLADARLDPLDAISVAGLDDAIVRARLRGQTVSFGEDIRKGPLFARLPGGSDRGSFTAIGGIDQVPRLFSYWVLPEYRLVVTVAIGEAGRMAALQQRQSRYFQAAAVASFGIVGFAALLMLAWSSNRRAQQASNRLAAIVESAENAFVGEDLHGIVTTWNAGAEKLVGYTAAEMIGQPVARLVPPDRGEPAPAALGHRTDASPHREAVWVGKDGRLIDVSVTLSAIRGAGGRVVGASRMAFDISAEKRLRDALVASEQRYRQLFESARDGLMIVDAETGVIEDVNPCLTELLDGSREQLMGRNVQELHCFSELAKKAATLETLRRAEAGRLDDVPIETLQGRRIQVELTSNVLMAVGRRVIQCSLRDVTERRRAEQARRESESRYRTLFEHAPDGIVIVGADGTYLDANAAMCRMTGYRLDELLALRAVDIVDAVERPRLEEAFGLVEAGADYDQDWNLRRRDGALMPVEVISSRMPEGHLIAVIRDVGERKRNQAALRELNAELESRVLERTAELKIARDEAQQADRAKSAFLATMSHEIRTPMNGVIGLVEVLQQTALAAHQAETVELIRDSGLLLLRIIDDILDFSKIEAGKLSIENTPMPLADVVEKVGILLHQSARRHAVKMSVFVDPAIPGTVLGDAARLRQVLVNLLGNAVKFSSGRPTEGRVSIRARLVERSASSVLVDLIVSDDGIGIEEAALARLFAPFSQADESTTRRFGGTGLGLAITDLLVRLMNGAITVRSQPGQGSTFSVRLRFETPAQPECDDSVAGARLSGLRCRVVGSEQPLADDLALYLAAAGARVERSADLPAAAADADSSRSDLWLVLPGETNPTLAELRAASGHGTRGFVVLEWGAQRRPQREAGGVVTLNADALPRATLLDALALAAETDPRPTAAAEAAPAPSRRSAPERQQALDKRRLLLVAEDNAINRVLIIRQLALIGYAADVAVDGEDALRLWRSVDYALLLTDLRMPKLDGYELAAAIRAEEAPGRRKPIIALTANALREEEARCLAAGMDRYLTKPISLQQLNAALEEWLGAPQPE